MLSRRRMNTTSAFAVVSALASTLVATACSSDASDPGGTDAAVFWIRMHA